MPNFIEIEEVFLWTDGRTYVWMDGHLRPILLGRLRRVDLKMKQFCDKLIRLQNAEHADKRGKHD